MALFVKGSAPDKQKLFQERLKRCDLQLQKVLKIDKRNLRVEMIDIKELQSIFLERNGMFVFLLKEIENWNNQVKQYQQSQKEYEQMFMAQTLMKMLFANLSEIVNTKDRYVQEIFVLDTYNWYNFNSQCLYGSGGSTHLSSNSQLYSSHQNSRTDFFKSQHDINEADLQYRTPHPFLQPPQSRLFDYQRKILSTSKSSRDGFATDSQMFASRPDTRASEFFSQTQSQFFRPISQQDNRPGTTFSMISTSPGPQGWHYTNAFNNFVYSGQPNQNDSVEKKEISVQEGGEEGIDGVRQQRLDANQQEGMSPDNKRSNEEGEQNGSPIQLQGDTSPAIKKKSVELQKPYPNFPALGQDQLTFAFSDNNNNRGFQNGGFNHQNYNKKELKSIFLAHDQGKTIADLAMEKKWLDNQHKAVIEIRENEEIGVMMNNWASNKGRVEEEIGKKSQIMKLGSQFGRVGKSKLKKKETPIYVPEPNQIQQKEQSDFDRYAKVLNMPRNQKEKKNYNPSEFLEHEVVKPVIEESANQEISESQNMNISLAQNLPRAKTANNFFTRKDPRYIEFKNGESTVFENIDAYHSNQNINDLEYKMKLEKINQIRKFRGEIINGLKDQPHNIEDQEVQRRREISLVTTSRPQTMGGTRHRPFSRVFSKVSFDMIKRENVFEVEKTKKVLAQKGVQCSFNTLKESLTIPTGLPAHQLENLFPDTYDRFMSNPFQVTQQKPKKKQK